MKKREKEEDMHRLRRSPQVSGPDGPSTRSAKQGPWAVRGMGQGCSRRESALERRQRVISWGKQRKESRWETLWRDRIGWRAGQAFTLETRII